jgi:uncharacterized lipoprotein YddW (UPF0748 family)
MKSSYTNIFYIIWVLIVIIIIGFLTINILPPAQAQTPNQNLKGMWLTGQDYKAHPKKSDIKASMDRLNRLGFNTVFINVYHGCTIYQSPLTINGKAMDMYCAANREYKNRDFIAEIIENKGNMKVCAWYEYGYMASTSNPVYMNNKSTALINQKGANTDTKGEMWLNPNHTDVIAMQKGMLKNLFDKYPAINCIQYDDHFGYNSQMGYDANTIKEFKATKTTDFTRFRANKFTQNVTELLSYAHSLRPSLTVSMSPGDIQGSYDNYLQDALKWAKMNIGSKKMIDNFIVQIYRADMATYTPVFDRQATKAMIATGANVNIALSGFANGKDLSNKTIKEMHNYAKQRGFQGVSLFYDRYFKYDNTGRPIVEREQMMKNL